MSNYSTTKKYCPHLWETITHEVANIAFLAVEKLNTPPDTTIFNRFRQEYFKAAKRDIAQSKARKEILAALHSHEIYTLEVQGTVVKQYYPQSHLRMMSDLDFIIPEDKFNEAEKVMQGLGYETTNRSGIEIDAHKDIVVVELHLYHRFRQQYNYVLNFQK